MSTSLLSVAARALESPDAVGLIVHDVTLSFAELRDRVERAASKLTDFERPLALVAEPSLPALVMLYACLFSQKPVLLIHPAMPNVGQVELMQEVGADSLFRGELQRLDPSVDGPLRFNSREAQVLVPTSGSSGSPKIVLLSAEQMCASALAANANLPLSRSSRWALTLPFAHVGGLSVLIRCLVSGAAPVVPKHSLASESGAVEYEAQLITHLSVVPTQLTRLLDAGIRPPSTLEAVLVGGASCSPALRARARAAGYPVLVTYGMTEMSSQVSTQSPNHKPNPVAADEWDSGRPLAGIEVMIDEKGVLLVRGPSLASGYYNVPREQFCPHGWFRTGDLARLDGEGRIYIQGRADNLIISGGENVNADSVERHLRDAPGVREVCVIGVPDAEWGQRVVAALVVDDGAAPDIEALQRSLKIVLPSFSCPKDYLIFQTLPLLPSGKPNRRLVAQQCAALLGV